ncbi:hypothetical protein BDBG_07241 [Blastomyces gilchristii SLH14081]|uniref:Uncharacterized protein n=1 Tax=Blastomyces gilchristii (strain SLH14081) TaxID=559298 RepID=A0A179UXI1_BLAGS|nr:uncharacterized protein BDBG_07241 [Blastomyces gilchristii SLH14081]OAT11817.1 hypothetical protein BDBG_07241 [Blastomyces gilchristii SLH14081]
MPNSGCEYYDPVEGECGRTCAQNSTYCDSRKRMNSQAMDFTDKPSIRRRKAAMSRKRRIATGLILSRTVFRMSEVSIRGQRVSRGSGEVE